MKKAKRNNALRPQHILLGCFLVLIVLGGVYLAQNTKLAEIKREQAALKETYEAMLLEEQRLDGMLGYVQTDAYMMQYAREKLGYVGPNDYKFYREEPTE